MIGARYGYYVWFEPIRVSNGVVTEFEFCTQTMNWLFQSDQTQGGLSLDTEIRRTLPRSSQHGESVNLAKIVLQTESLYDFVWTVDRSAVTQFQYFTDPTYWSCSGCFIELWEFQITTASDDGDSWRRKITGRVETVESLSENVMQFNVIGGEIDLDVPFEESVYVSPARAELAGQVKQRCFGSVLRAPAVRITIDNDTTPTFEINGGNNCVNTVSADWYIDGLLGSVAPYSYSISENHTLGQFTVSGAMTRSHYDGAEISADTRSDDLGGGVGNETLRQPIIAYILEDEGPLSSGHWVESSMTAACTNNNVGFVVNDYVTIEELMEGILEPQVVMYPQTDGAWRFFRYPANVDTETSLFDIGESDITEEGVRRTVENEEPAHSVSVEYGRKWSRARELTGRGKKILKKRQKKYERNLRAWARDTRKYTKKYRKDHPDLDLPPWLKLPGVPRPILPDWNPPARPKEPDWEKIYNNNTVDMLRSQWAVATDATIKTKYPNSEHAQYESYLLVNTQAATEAANALAWAKVPRLIYTIPISRRARQMTGDTWPDIGDIFTITYPEWGLESGKKMVCIDVRESLKSDTIYITGWR